MNVAVEATLDLTNRFFEIETEFRFDEHAGEPLLQILIAHLGPQIRIVVVRVAPLVQAHLGRDEVHGVREALSDRFPLAVLVNRDRSLMSVLDRPDDVLGAPCSVSTDEDALARGHERPSNTEVSKPAEKRTEDDRLSHHGIRNLIPQFEFVKV